MGEPRDRRITDGGRALRAYLTEHGVNVPDFCTKHGLDRIQVQRVLNGDRYKRISVEFANAIELATGGVIPYTAFLPNTAVPAAASSVDTVDAAHLDDTDERKTPSTGTDD